MDTPKDAEAMAVDQVRALLEKSLVLAPRELEQDETDFMPELAPAAVPTRTRSRAHTGAISRRESLLRPTARRSSVAASSLLSPTDGPEETLRVLKSRQSSRRGTLVAALPTSAADEGAVPPEWRSRYQTVSVIGHGGFATIYLVSDLQEHAMRALKHISRTLVPDKERLEVEVRALQTTRHPNIVALYDALATPSSLHLVMDYCAGGCLFDRMLEEDLCEAECALILRQVLQALAHLHEHGIVHRDVKLENVLLKSRASNTDVQLADFGIARILSDAERSASTNARRQMITSYVGTIAYMAPEMFANDGYGEPVDLWATGVMLYMLLSCMSPFGNEENASELVGGQIQRICAGEYSFYHPVWTSYSASAKSLITRLLEPLPYERYSAHQALAHPWIHNLVPADSGAVLVSGGAGYGWTASAASRRPSLFNPVRPKETSVLSRSDQVAL